MFDFFNKLRLFQKPPNNDHNNPVHSDWMGSEISWRLWYLQDNLGPLSKNQEAYKKFKRVEYTNENDHEHCQGCWTTISTLALSEYYKGSDPVYGNPAHLCPICFALFKAANEGIISVKVTNREALTEHQSDWK